MRRITENESRTLQAAIVGAGLRRYRVAIEAGIAPDRLSKILRGDRVAEPGEFKRIGAAIKRLGARR